MPREGSQPAIPDRRRARGRTCTVLLVRAAQRVAVAPSARERDAGNETWSSTESSSATQVSAATAPVRPTPRFLFAAMAGVAVAVAIVGPTVWWRARSKATQELGPSTSLGSAPPSVAVGPVVGASPPTEPAAPSPAESAARGRCTAADRRGAGGEHVAACRCRRWSPSPITAPVAPSPVPRSAPASPDARAGSPCARRQHRAAGGPTMIAVAARRLALVASLGAVASWSAPALAADPASAQALFNQGRKLMLEEKWAEACPKLQESQRLNPAGGTLLHLALCREREGRIATAWAIYVDALSQAKRDGRKDRSKIAQERIDALAPKLPRLKSGSRRRTGRRRASRSLERKARSGRAVGQPVPRQSGEGHALGACAGEEAPQHRRRESRPAAGRSWSTSRPSGRRSRSPRRRTPSPHPDEARRVTVARSEPSGTSRAAQASSASPSGASSGSSRWGRTATRRQSVARPTTRSARRAGVQAGKDAISAGNVSTVAFVVGGALLVGGAALYFTAPSSRIAVVPAVGPREAGLGVHGEF